MLWQGGSASRDRFIFTGLIALPILAVYRKHHGTRMAVLHVRRHGRGAGAHVTEARVSWNYTTWLNIIFPVLATALTVRFARTGGAPGPGGTGHARGSHAEGRRPGFRPPRDAHQA